MPPGYQYHVVDDAERLENYEPNGYHPIMIDDILHNRYRIVNKLGYGGYSTVWIARDETARRYVRIKVGISGAEYPQREPEILQALHNSISSSQAPHAALNTNLCEAIPRVLDTFDIHGPNGTHPCYTFTLAAGNLDDAKFNDLFPIRVARALSAKLATVVAFVHSRGFVHGDIRLPNLLVKLPKSFDVLSVEQFYEEYGRPGKVPIVRFDGKPLTPNVPTEVVIPRYLGKHSPDFTLADAQGLILNDFGGAFSPATEQRLQKDSCIPKHFTAPEVFFEPDEILSYPSDIWSLATCIWEILGMKMLFSDWASRDEIVSEQIDVLGFDNFPEKWKQQWERAEEEEDKAEWKPPRRPSDRDEWPKLEKAFEDFVQTDRMMEGEKAGVFGDEETRAILELMRGMLTFRPEERLTIDGVLKSKWMVNWALPELESS